MTPVRLLTRPAWAASALAVLLAACATPGPQAPLPAPRALPAAGAAETSGSASGPAFGPADWPAPDWWRVFADPALDTLVQRALADAPSLAAAQARVQRAAALQALSDAGRAVQIGLSAEATDQRFTARGLIPPPVAGSIGWTATLQVGAAWSPDLAGGQRAALQAAIGQRRAAEADLQAARVMLAGQVAATHFQLAALLDQRRVVATAEAQRAQVAALVAERRAAGLDTELELQQARGQVAQARTQGLALDDAIDRARHALAELTAQPPAALQTHAPTLAVPRPLPPNSPWPADLLGRRADLVAARWRVDAATAGVAEARAAFYPSINLNAFVGLSSLGLDRWLDLGARQYGAGPALHLPLFDGGRLQAQLGGRRAEVGAAVAAYDGALLRALREVADALGTQRAVVAQQAAQAEAAAAAERAYALALARYRAGLGNYLVVLTAQSTVLLQQQAASDLRGRRLAADVALALALGGGFGPETTDSGKNPT
ncbi:MAG: efflux transporter outer membrane subunit [Burkholderiaceae bacterium]|nr:efflux transporter outer membrane subunit [Burkholderiaceae bacterium]